MMVTIPSESPEWVVLAWMCRGIGVFSSPTEISAAMVGTPTEAACNVGWAGAAAAVVVSAAAAAACGSAAGAVGAATAVDTGAVGAVGATMGAASVATGGAL